MTTRTLAGLFLLACVAVGSAIPTAETTTKQDELQLVGLAGTATSKTIVIAGLARDTAQKLPHLLQDLTDVACLFSNAVLVVLESNSADNTLQVLRNFEAAPQGHCRTTGRASSTPFKEVKVIAAPASPKKQHRINRLVHYRNELRNELTNFGTYDHVLLVDMDIYGIDTAALQSNLESYVSEDASKQIDAICLNDHFRDSYATVSKDGRKWAYPESWRTRRLGNGPIADWYRTMNHEFDDEVGRRHGDSSGVFEVSSCFNAATLYTSKAYFTPACLYKTTQEAIDEDFRFSFFASNSQANLMCEHVYFHVCLRRNVTGFRIGLTLFKDYVKHSPTPQQQQQQQHSTTAATNTNMMLLTQLEQQKQNENRGAVGGGGDVAVSAVDSYESQALIAESGVVPIPSSELTLKKWIAD